jgi:hypothetical protein
MKLEDINKQLYRKRLNIVIAASIVTLLVLALVFGAILIALFGDALPTIDPVSGEKVSNFRFNFVGVIFSLLTCASILQSLKRQPFFYEIYYVWKLKQIQNIIYRRLKKIKLAAEQQRDPVDENAFIVLKYYYASLKQVYTLDDNTLTMSVLTKNINNLNTLMDSLDIKVETGQFERKMLISYR